MVRVTVRVGDYKVDSSTARVDGSIQFGASLDNDPLALRASLWQATDQAYKAALAAYSRKQAALKQVQTPPQADDFSQEKPVILLEKTVELEPRPWIGRSSSPEPAVSIGPNSALAEVEHTVQYATAGFHARAVNTYLVNSEGTIVRKGQTAYD